MADETSGPAVDPVGREMYRKLFGEAVKEPLDGLYEHTINHLYAKIWSRPGLTMRERSMITVAILAATGRLDELARHIQGARLGGGMSEAEIIEILIHVAHYAGWPAGRTGEAIAREVFEELRKRADSTPEQTETD